MSPPDGDSCEDSLCRKEHPHRNLYLLPNEVLIHLFKNLPIPHLITMGKVSERFDRVVKHWSVWEHTQVDMFELEEKNDMITLMLPHRKHITSLTIQMTTEGHVKLDKKIVAKLIRFRRLGHLVIKGAVITSDLLERLPHRLKSLQLIRCSMPKDQMANLESKLPSYTSKPKNKIESLSIIDCQGIRFDKPPRMGKGDLTRFPCLRTFHLNGTYRNSDTLFLEEAALDRILSTTLEVMDLSRG